MRTKRANGRARGNIKVNIAFCGLTGCLVYNRIRLYCININMLRGRVTYGNVPDTIVYYINSLSEVFTL
jgi:hypothetical protein